MSERRTKPSAPAADDMAAEYDVAQLKNQVQGKYAGRFASGAHLVLIDADVAAVFPDSESVNRALRLLIEAVGRSRPVPKPL